MSIADELNAISVKESNPRDINQYRQETTAAQKLANAVADMIDAVKETYNEDVKQGEILAAAAGEAYKAGVLNSNWESLDNPVLNSPELTEAQRQFQSELDDRLYDARMTAGRDPANVVSTAVGVTSPLAGFAIAAPFMAYDIKKAAEQGEGGTAAGGLAAPIGAGVVAHTAGALLKSKAPIISKMLTTPFFGSAAGAGAAAAYDPNMASWMVEHPARAVFNFAGTDIGMGVKKLMSYRVTSHPPVYGEAIQGANIESANIVKGEKETTAAVSSTPDKTTADTAVSDTSEQPTQVSNANKEQGVKLNDKVSAKSITKNDEKGTENGIVEEVVPELNSDVKAAHEELVQKTEEARLEQEKYGNDFTGAYGTKIKASAENVYKDHVTIEDIFATANLITSTHVGRLLKKLPTAAYHFSTKFGAIRVRAYDSFSDMSHEIGHEISSRTKWGTGTLVIKELKEGALSVWKDGQYGDPLTPAGHRAYIEEGRALFMNEYLLNPEMAQEHFPAAYRQFQEEIAKQAELAANVELLGQQMRRYYTDTEWQKANASIHYGYEDKGVSKNKIDQELTKVMVGVSDSLYAVRHAIKSLEDKFHVKIAAIDNPADLMQSAKQSILAHTMNFLGQSDSSTMDIIKAEEAYYNTSLNKVTLDNILQILHRFQETKDGKKWLTTIGFTDGQGAYEAFATYGLARHILEVIKVQNAKRITALNEKLKTYMSRLTTVNKEVTIATIKAESSAKTALPYREKLAKLKERIAEAKKVKLANKVEELTEQYNTLKEVATPFIEEANADSKALKRAQARQRRVVKVIERNRQHIKDIQKGKDDYNTAIARERAERIVKEVDQQKELKRLKHAFKLWQKYNQNMLTIAEARGLISADYRKYLLETYPDYVPMQRSFAIDGNPDIMGVLNGVGSVNIPDVIKALSATGSDRPTYAFLEQAVYNTNALISKAERNRAGQALLKLSDTIGSSLAERVKGTASRAEMVVEVWDKGKKVALKIQDPLVYEALTGEDRALQAATLNLLEKTAQDAATILRIGATALPPFGVFNLIKDVLNATLFDKNNSWLVLNGKHIPLPVIDQVAMLINGIRYMCDKKIMAEIRTTGVLHTTHLGHRKKVSTNLKHIVDPEHGKWKARGNTFKNVLSFLSEKGEQLPRVASYVNNRRAGATPFMAAMAATENTANFYRAGTMTKGINKYTAFFNAIIQGNAAAWRAVAKDPQGFALRAMLYLAIPSLSLWLYNRDKDWYKDMPLDQKNKAWYIDFSGNGTNIWVIPKSEGLPQIFSSFIERIADYMFEQAELDTVPHTAKKILVDDALPSVFPTAALPLLEWISNYDFYTGRQLEDMHMQQVAPAKRYNIYTSEVSKRIGAATNLSPVKLDNTLYGLTGGCGYAFTFLTDLALKKEKAPTKKWSEYTRFNYTAGTAKTETADYFYSNLQQLQYEDSEKDFTAPKSKELEAMEKALNKKDKKKRIDKMGIKQLSREIKLIREQDGVDGDTKRVEIDKLIEARNNLMREVNTDVLGYKYISKKK